MTSDQLLAMPVDLRDLHLPSGTTLIGRYHQGQFFEKWLPNALRRNSISRISMQMVAKANGLQVTNMSGNIICIDHRQMEKGETCQLRPGQIVSFAAPEPSGNMVHFLMMQVRFGDHVVATVLAPPDGKGGVEAAAQNADAAGNRVQRRRVTVAPAAMAASIAPPPPEEGFVRKAGKAITLPASYAATGCTSPRERRGSMTPLMTRDQLSPRRLWPNQAGPLPEHVASKQVVVAAQQRPNHPAGAFAVTLPNNAAAVKLPAAAVESPEFVLELSGTGTKDARVLQRTIGPMKVGKGAIVVGKRYQSDFHTTAIKPSLLSQLEDDVFCICYESSQFLLMSLSSHRMWQHREGEAMLELKSNVECASLRDGDRILIGCGSVTLPMDAQFCWVFRLATSMGKSSLAT